MKLYTYDIYLQWKKYFSHNLPCTLKEDSLPYLTLNSDDLDEMQINDVHDKSYRDLLNNKYEFAFFLKKFVGYDVNPNHLQKCNNAFVTENFHNRRSDIVYKIANRPVYIFVEHQSSIDNAINFRLFDYYSLVLNDTVEQDKLKNKNYKFPIIVPILLYTGTQKWNLVSNFKEKQANDEIFNSKKLDYAYDFINIHDYSIEELLDSNTSIGYIMATDKCSSKNELYEVFNKLSCMDITDAQRKVIQRFLFFVFDKSFSKDDKNELIQKFNKGVDEKMKCAWQYLIEDIRRDRAEGRAEGKVEGRTEGRAQRSFEIITNMLKNGETIDKIKLYTGFSKQQIKDIERKMNASVS